MYREFFILRSSRAWVLAFCIALFLCASTLSAQETETPTEEPATPVVETPSEAPDEATDQPTTEPEVIPEPVEVPETVTETPIEVPVVDIGGSGGGGESTPDTDEPLITETISTDEPLPMAPEIETLPLEEVDETHALALQNESLIFGLNEPFTLRFVSEVPLMEPPLEESAEPEDVSVVDAIIETVSEFTQDVAEGIADVIEAVTDQVVTSVEEVVSFFSDEEELEVIPERAPVIEEIATDEEPVEVLSEEEEASEIVTNEIESLDTIRETTSSTSDEFVAVEEILEVETIAIDPNAPVVRGYVDGVLVASDIVSLSENGIELSVMTSSLYPGLHTVRVEVQVKDDLHTWEGQVMWGGEITFSVGIPEIGNIFVIQYPDTHIELWFDEVRERVHSYVLLDSDFLLDATAPISYFDGNIFWLARSKDATHGYNVLSHSFFSQTLEKNDETEIIIDEQKYLMETDATSFDFTSVIPPLLP